MAGVIGLDIGCPVFPEPRDDLGCRKGQMFIEHVLQRSFRPIGIRRAEERGNVVCVLDPPLLPFSHAVAPHPSGEPRERVISALKFLKIIGSAADLTEEDGKIVISSYGCPIAGAVSADARSCITMEALLKELTELPVTEHCDHGEHPSCRFQIKIPADK